MLLAIDTSELTCSAAIIEADNVLMSRSEEIGRGHAERLLPLIAELMTATGVNYKDLTRLAVTTGPGTFTGLRVGLSVARGIALVNGISCIGISGLQVLAKQAQRALDEKSIPIHAVINGRGDQMFYQRFHECQNDGVPKKVGVALNADFEIIAESIKQAPGVIAGSGSALLKQHGFDALFQQNPSLSSRDTQMVIDPECLGLMASDLDPYLYAPEPLYLRDADAKKAVPLLPVDAV